MQLQTFQRGLNVLSSYQNAEVEASDNLWVIGEGGGPRRPVSLEHSGAE